MALTDALGAGPVAVDTALSFISSKNIRGFCQRSDPCLPKPTLAFGDS